MQAEPPGGSRLGPEGGTGSARGQQGVGLGGLVRPLPTRPVLSPRSCSVAAALEGGAEAADGWMEGFSLLLLPVSSRLRLYPLCRASCCPRAPWGAAGGGLAPPEPGGPSLARCPFPHGGSFLPPNGLHLVTFQEGAPALVAAEPRFPSRCSWGSLGPFPQAGSSLRGSGQGGCLWALPASELGPGAPQTHRPGHPRGQRLGSY